MQRLWFSYSGAELSETKGWLLVAAALEEYLEGRQNGAGPPFRRLLWMEEAGRRLGLDVSQVERLVEQGNLRGGTSIRREGVSWIDSHSIRRLAREIERMQPALEAAVDLGIGLGQLGDLARYGLLSPDSGPEIDGCDETKFSRKTLADFIVEGHFGAHIRRMRNVYRERREVLLESIARHLGSRLRIGASDTGLHVTGWLPQAVNDQAISERAMAKGLDTPPLSRYYLANHPPPGLLLNYASVTPPAIQRGIRALASIF